MTYSLPQVEHGVDIGNPAYGQLQKIHSVDTENVRVGGEEDSQVRGGAIMKDWSVLFCLLI